jgi:hypothetical protein
MERYKRKFKETSEKDYIKTAQSLDDTFKEIEKKLINNGWKYHYQIGTFTKEIEKIEFSIRLKRNQIGFHNYSLPIIQFLFDGSTVGIKRFSGMYDVGKQKPKQNIDWYLKDLNIINEFKKNNPNLIK